MPAYHGSWWFEAEVPFSTASKERSALVHRGKHQWQLAVDAREDHVAVYLRPAKLSRTNSQKFLHCDFVVVLLPAKAVYPEIRKSACYVMLSRAALFITSMPAVLQQPHTRLTASPQIGGGDSLCYGAKLDGSMLSTASCASKSRPPPS